MTYRKSSSFFWTLPLFAAVILGILIPLAPPSFFLALIFFPLFLWVCFVHTHIAATIAIGLICGLGLQFLPEISVGPGSIKAYEPLSLIVLAGAIRSHYIDNDKDKNLFAFRDLWIFWCFVLLSFFGALNGLMFNETAIKPVLQELRIQYCWLFAPISYFIFRNERNAHKYLDSLLALGIILALVSGLQYFTGFAISSKARVEALNTLNEVNAGITRTGVPGTYFICLALYLIVSRRLIDKASKIFTFSSVIILIFALLVSFGRALWFGSFVGFLFLMWLMRGGRGVIIVITFSGIIGLVVAIFGSLLFPDFTLAVLDRLQSVQYEGFRNSSFDWRLEEVTFAFQALQTNPVFGIGLGTYYKPSIVLGDDVTTELMQRYIHNSYLGLWLKFGFFGPLLAVVTAGWIFVKGFRMISVLEYSENSRLFAILAAFLVPLITSFTQPEWLADAGVAFIGVTVGILASISHSSASRRSADL